MSIFSRIDHKFRQYKLNNDIKKHSYLNKVLGEEGYNYFKGLLSNPERSVAYKTSAWFLANVGLTDQAIPLLEKSLAIQYDHEALVFYLQFLMFTSPEKFSHKYLYKAYTKWGKKLVSPPIYKTYVNSLTQNRRLRIGYTCHFITNSTSSTLLVPLLKAHNRERVEVFMYSDQDPQQTSDETRNIVEHWHDMSEVNDEEFCEQIRKDKIDIMIELNGHVIKNRYKALTKRPAPLQVGYYNHAATCGVPGIDYLLVGEDFKTDHLQPYYSEKIFHKQGITLATIISPHFPPVKPAPFLTNGYITFGSFGQSHKVSIETIKLWSAILKRVPHSKLFFKTNILDFPAYKSVYIKHFADCGIDLSRLILEGPSDYATLLKCYERVDIALDTLPYAAGTTTMEACISGVPVISHTQIGDRISSQIGYYNLNSIGHDELLACSKEEYIEKAVKLAFDPNRLVKYRETLRDDVKHSRRGNMSLFISELEDAYYKMWSHYINANK